MLGFASFIRKYNMIFRLPQFDGGVKDGLKPQPIECIEDKVMLYDSDNPI